MVNRPGKTSRKLTKKLIESLTLPDEGQVFVWDANLKGFGVRLTPGRISYFVQSRVNGRTRRVTIGKHGVFTLEEARDKAREELRDMGKGIDPVEKKRRDKATQITLKEAATTYKSSKKTRDGHPLKESTQKDIDKHVNGTFRKWRDISVCNITEEMVRAVYNDAAERSVAQANQAFRILRAIINWTRDKSMAKGIIIGNPVNALKGEWGHVPTRNSKIPVYKFGTAWNAINELREWPGQTVASKTSFDLATFLLVTGARFTEGASLLWENISFDEHYWRLLDPKNRQPVTFPLSSVTHEILEGRPRTSPFVFPGTGRKGHIRDIRVAMSKLSDKIDEKLTPHDLRRSFMVAAGKANVEFVRCKLLMNHKLSGDVTVSSYTDTSDLRWLADDAEKVAQWIREQGRIAAAENVVDIEMAKQRA